MKVVGELNDGLHLNLHAPLCTESVLPHILWAHIIVMSPTGVICHIYVHPQFILTSFFRACRGIPLELREPGTVEPL